MLVRPLHNSVETGGRLERARDLMGRSRLQVTERYTNYVERLTARRHGRVRCGVRHRARFASAFHRAGSRKEDGGRVGPGGGCGTGERLPGEVEWAAKGAPALASRLWAFEESNLGPTPYELAIRTSRTAFLVSGSSTGVARRSRATRRAETHWYSGTSVGTGNASVGQLPALRPHIHALVTDGGFPPDGTFVRQAAHSTEVLTKAFRRGG